MNYHVYNVLPWFSLYKRYNRFNFTVLVAMVLRKRLLYERLNQNALELSFQFLARVRLLEYV